MRVNNDERQGMSKMVKYVVIDGMARCGSTLLSSIIHSQTISRCYRGVFHEHLAQYPSHWPIKQAVVPLKTAISKSIRHPLPKTEITCQSLENIERSNQCDFIKYEEWEKIFWEWERSNSSIDKMYENLAKRLNTQILAFRWNQGVPHAINWITRSKNHLWIAVVRNPIDQYGSIKKAFNWSSEDYLKALENYSDILGMIKKQPQVKILYFEDLINEPEAIVKDLYKFLEKADFEISFNLKSQNGLPYRVETSDLPREQRRNGKEFVGFDKTMIGKYDNNLKAKESAILKKICYRSEIFGRYRNDSRLNK